MTIRQIGIVAKDSSHVAKELAFGLAHWLRQRGVKPILDRSLAASTSEVTSLPIDQLCQQVDLVIVIGGDGTLLRVCRHITQGATAVLGINAGNLGFLAEIQIEDTYAVMPRLLAGELPYKDRVKLCSQVCRGAERVANYVALNDAVITKGALSRMVELDIAIDRQRVTHLKADGVVVSTPTGSTAYSLAAGGPILYPSLRSFVMTPICPNTLTLRPIVVPDHVQIEITLQSRDSDVVQTMDGQVGFSIQHGDRILISRAEHPVRIYGSPTRDYFSVLRSKLRWGEP